MGKPTRSGNFTVSNKDTDGIYLVIYQIDINYTSAQVWMRDLGLVMNITACGADTSQLEGMADACPINESGYVVLTREDVIEVLRQSL